ncbi:uncharacterized protein FA14DRAFT_171612 [Meira miltonrushii]|uniref:Uncharacterized protein n=1 Tax=Meira miltonrushii TaxID=1280837 RepID=A0A316VBI5_9BASI|nr:uncharacterized protein FA14DRAFT_171612 [Meira miltonrushii]PWN34886.1 hypothetical protein FA14DRAFT_171612 [Meira miltonrushii]
MCLFICSPLILFVLLSQICNPFHLRHSHSNIIGKMYAPIRRSAYPDTRDEQAMRRFMLGTLNVGHHLTFQRKGNVVNLFPQQDEKEKLVKIFEDKKIHKNERCVNARLILHDVPLPPEKQLCRDLEFQIHPYNLAEVTLMPAECLSETGKARNMHMQTHNDLPDVHPVHVFGIGQRKGQLALLQFVKDSYDFKRDLLLDEQEDAARNSRSFVLPRTLNPTEQLANIPADPNRHFRDLFESQSQQATTPSEVGYNAHQAAMQYFHGNLQAGMAATRPVNTSIPARREGDVFGSSASADNQRFHPSTLVSRFQPQIQPNQLATEVTSSQAVPSQPPPMMNQTASAEQIVNAGKAAAQRIYQASPPVNPSGEQAIPQLPDVREFLDVERYRYILQQQKDTQAYEMFAAWQNSQRYACQPSWAGYAKSNLAGPSAYESTGMDDSGIATSTQDPMKQIGESSRRGNASSDANEENVPNEGGSANQTIPAQHLLYTNAPSHPLDRQKDQERHEEHEDAPTPTMSAASTLLSLSPAKVKEVGQPNTH